jgi:hypothetical protein
MIAGPSEWAAGPVAGLGVSRLRRDCFAFLGFLVFLDI